MNPHPTQFSCGNGSASFPASPFSAFHFLRSYNYLLAPDVAAKHFLASSHLLSEGQLSSSLAGEKPIPPLRGDSERQFVIQQKPFGYWQAPPTLTTTDFATSRTNLLSPECESLFGSNFKKHRGEKRAIPEEQKDDKYFERRKRNNQAAKKSRDARKIREDQIALKATILEHENAILRAQILTLRDEASTLRQLLMEKKEF